VIAFLAIGILMGLCALLFVGMTLCFLTQIVANGISFALSKLLNNATQKQLKKLAYGDDSLGETSTLVADRPSWTFRNPKLLPEELSKEISKVSDEAMAVAVMKLRSALGMFEFLTREEGGAMAFAKILSSHELIHTTYFAVPRFRKLIAYAISQEDGFRASDEFIRDPDYETIKRWHEELVCESDSQTPAAEGSRREQEATS